MTRRLGLLGLSCACVLATACGTEGSAPSDPVPSDAPPESAGGPTTTPAPPTTAEPPDTPAGPVDRARCGAKSYSWLPTATMGKLVDQVSLSSHTPVELNLASIALVNSNKLKTKRTAKLSTEAAVIRYTTQDRGKQIEATAAVAYPKDSAAKTYPVLLFLHGTVGFSDNCAPTRGLLEGAGTIDAFTNQGGLLLGLLASYGYIVVFPDYIGLKGMGLPSGMMHPYLIGEATAIASLDAVRAAKELLAGKTTSAGDVVVVGGSQGGHAAAFVDRFAPHYAPELSPKASVWVVPPTDLTGHAEMALTSWVPATVNMTAFLTAADAWYGASPNGMAGALLPPFATSVPAAMMSQCGGDVLDNATLQTLFTPGLLAAGQSPALGGANPWACYAAENSLETTSVPRLNDVPTLFLTGQNDPLVSTALEREAAKTLCGQGYHLQYLECEGAGHVEPFSWGWDEWLGFLDARLSGTPLTGTCTIGAARKCSSTP